MQRLSLSEAKSFLRSHGVGDPKEVAKIISGFDLDYPLMESPIEEGQELFQYIRLPSAGYLLPRLGNWFSLSTATTQGVAIIDGGSGRRFHRMKALRTFPALEGTACKFASMQDAQATAREVEVSWKHAVGGPGGATQYFVPSKFLGHLEAVSPEERPL